MKNDLEEDLKQISTLMDSSVIDELRNKKIFFTGGTGFFGVWLLEWFNYANRNLALNLQVVVLTRNPQNFKEKAPHLVIDPLLSFLNGDIKDFKFPKDHFDYIIHAATEASEILNNNNPIEMIDSIVSGTRRTLEFAAMANVKKMLFVSSGAVYGKQPPEITHVSEDCLIGPDVLNPRNAYAESKRLAELLCGIYSKLHGIDIPVARCFAFVGPYLNLDIHFAIGNFIRNGIDGKTIEIKGDGTPMRSYMYSADLVVWLLTVLIKGQSARAYNLGSDVSISIEELAFEVSECFDSKVEVKIRQKPQLGNVREQYVPDIGRSKKELNLNLNFDLKTSIMKTINWYKKSHHHV